MCADTKKVARMAPGHHDIINHDMINDDSHTIKYFMAFQVIPINQVHKMFQSQKLLYLFYCVYSTY